MILLILGNIAPEDGLEIGNGLSPIADPPGNCHLCNHDHHYLSFFIVHLHFPLELHKPFIKLKTYKSK